MGLEGFLIGFIKGSLNRKGLIVGGISFAIGYGTVILDYLKNVKTAKELEAEKELAEIKNSKKEGA